MSWVGQCQSAFDKWPCSAEEAQERKRTRGALTYFADGPKEFDDPAFDFDHRLFVGHWI